MGYTHYFGIEKHTKEDAKGWEKALPIIRDIISNHNNLLQYECDVPKEPRVDSEMIRFNGIDNDGHETFIVRNSEHSEFCKTARKPYDLPVCKILLVLKAYLPNFTLGSDGFSAHISNPVLDGFWMEAIQGVYQYGISYKVKTVNEREPYCDLEPYVDHMNNWAG